jgi:hypothetical protein
VASLEPVGQLRTDAGLRCQVQDFKNMCQLQLDTEKIPCYTIMIKLPIEPYWANAAVWWLENHNSNTEEFRYWLYTQGVFPVQRKSFYPWIEFEDPELATMFQLRWA